VVIDCRPADRINPRDAAAFEITRMACRGIGWDYILAGTPGPILAANVRWLAGYRHPRHAVTEVGDVLLEAFREQSPLIRYRLNMPYSHATVSTPWSVGA